MTTECVNAIETHVQNLHATIQDNFDQRIDSAIAKLTEGSGVGFGQQPELPPSRSY